MADIIIDAGTLTANETERTVTGLLVPYGEECRSNLGRFSVDAGAFSLPDPSVVGFNVEHQREDVIGRATDVRETPEGVVATFSVAPGEDGDAALADIKSGRRKSLSAEVANVVIKAGKAVGGRLFGGALVAQPAFPSATLLAAAVDTPEPVEPVQPDDKDGVTETKTVVNADGSSTVTTTTTKTETDADGTVTEVKTVSTETVAKPVEETTEPTQEEETPVGVPNTLQASAKNKSGAPTKIGKTAFFSLLAAHDRGEVQGQDMQSLATMAKATGLFALNDVKYDGTGGITTGIQLPEWIGEVWDGNDYAQKYVPLFSHADLTSLSFQGFQWEVKPQGGDWAGNKSAVPSNTPKFKVVKADAQRYAMAHDIARELQDLRVFGDTNFFEMYFQAGVEDYKKWADNKVITALQASADSLVADNPAGEDIGPAMSALVDGASALIARNVTPTFALVGADYFKQIGKTTNHDTLGYLSASLGLRNEDGSLDGFSLVPSNDIAGTDVYVGAGQAITVRELPGSPLRADALDIARGGIDHGLFGYLGVQVNKPDALLHVTPYTAG
ncbi:hypothetical protein NY537_14745 [Curtobacterium flaccumfaciens pv. betae]|uniref:hypothetical protein n=1 Tax=Curtobacterium flaccumfaciens TaxID=2035 RepID=UPI0026587489|nr:hypothetical protein [Curtobacterium flaccumfaciens]MCS5513999.1 hypothetical protein [Curtobacterium flaccumfaciens pv. betae]